MEIPQADGNQEDQEKIDKKIIGRGFRPALKTPKNFPYPLELDHSSRYAELKFNEKRNNLYIGDNKLIRRAFVEVHPKGLRLVIDKKKYIIPGELGLAKTVDLLVGQYTPIKQILEDPDIKEKYIQKSLQGFNTLNNDSKVITDITQNIIEETKLLVLKHRKREIAGALLANGIWQKRGFVDKGKIAPKNFWQVVPIQELVVGDKRDLKRWWEDALVRSARELPGRENYGLEPYKNKNKISKEKNKLHNNKDNLTKEEYSAQKKYYQIHGIVERNDFLKIIRDKIKENFLPKYPWEIRHWDKIPFEQLKKALLYGLHKMPEWEAYIKSGAPQIEGVIDLLENDLTDEENVYDVGKFKLEQKNVFLQPFKPEIEERIRRSLALFTEGKILEAQRIFPNKNTFIYDDNKFVGYYDSYKKESIIKNKIRKKRENFIDIFKDERKNQFIIPDFASIDGWEWKKDGISVLALEIIEEEEKSYYQQSSYSFRINNDDISKDENMEIFFKEHVLKIEKVEKTRLENPYSLKCIAIKNEDGIQKEAILKIDPSRKCWRAIAYRNCDLDDLREVNVFCRTLSAIKKELKSKININAITNDISEEKVIENPLFYKPISQLNQTRGR